MVGGANSHLESNPIPTRDAQRAQANFVCTRTQGPHRDWDRTVFECLLWRYRSAADYRRGRVSGCSRLGYGISPLGGGHHPPYHRAARTYTGLGNRLLEGTNRTLCTRTWEKGAVNPQETNPDLPVSVQESPAETWVHGGLLQAGLGALSVAAHAWELLKEVTILSITSTIVWPQVNSREAAQLPHHG